MGRRETTCQTAAPTDASASWKISLLVLLIQWSPTEKPALLSSVAVGSTAETVTGCDPAPGVETSFQTAAPGVVSTQK